LDLVIVFVGVYVIGARGQLAISTSRDAWGITLAVCASIAFAMWQDGIEDFETRVESSPSRLWFLAFVFLVSYTIVVTVAYAKGHAPRFDRTDTLVLGANGLRVALVYWLLNLAIRRAGPLLPAIILLVQVPLTILLDRAVLATMVSTQLWIGAVLITLGTVSVLLQELDAPQPSH
jgi:drug/metabolite transporter (DMT)-like permease